MDEQLQQLKNFRERRKEGQRSGPLSPEQIQAAVKAKKLRLSSLHTETVSRKSPFMQTKTMKDYMKATLVNNSIFHGEFDPSLATHETLFMAEQLIGKQQAQKLAGNSTDFDKRYYQKYPKWQQLKKRDIEIQKKAFQKQCRMLYTGKRMQLANALEDLRRDTAEKTMAGCFDRTRMLEGEVPFPAGLKNLDKEKMSALLEEYRNKLFLYNKLEEFMPPHDVCEEDIRKLMETTGRIKQGEKVYEPFAEFLRQKAIYEQKYGEWKIKKVARCTIHKKPA